MTQNSTTIQNEFKDLLEAHFKRRMSSGSSRSKWPEEVVAKFAELLHLGHSAKFFEPAFGLTSNQFHSLKSRLQAKSTKPGFKKIKVEKPEKASSSKILSSTLYLRSASGVELRGIQSFDEALELFIKASR